MYRSKEAAADSRHPIRVSWGSQGCSSAWVQLTAGKDLLVSGNAISVSGGVQSGSAGTIYLIAGLANPEGQLLINGNLTANGSGSGSGGNVWVEAPIIRSTSGNGTSRLNANGGSSGNGGYVSMVTKPPSMALSIDGSGSEFLLSATGGTTAGNGGIVELITAGNLTLNGGNAVNVDGLGEGSGGQLTLAAGSNVIGYYTDEDGYFLPQVSFNEGKVFNATRGTYSANGAGSGSAGLVFISGPSINSSPIEPATGVGFQALGGANSSNGGMINMQSGGDIRVSSTNLNASAKAAGNGGEIRIKSAAGKIALSGIEDLSGGSVKALGGTVSGSGGEISISSSSDLTLDTPINASARGSGDGVSVFIQSISEQGSSIQIQNAVCQ